MKSPISARLAASLAIVVGSTCLTALQCADINDPNTIQGCNIFYDNNFPIDGTVSRNKPAKCPIAILGSTPIPYSATAELPAGSVTWQLFQVEVVTWNGYHGGFVPEAVWSQGGNGRYFVHISGTYYAGTGGWDIGNTGYDDVRNGFQSAYGSHPWTYGTIRISYFNGFPSNSIDAPSNVDLNQQFFVQATTNDPLMVNPVSWSWYLDGQYAGTTSQNNTYLYSANQNTVQQVQVLASDGTQSVWGQKTVIVGTGCSQQTQC